MVSQPEVTPPRRDDPRPPGLVLAVQPPDTPTELGAYLLAPDLVALWRQSATNYTTASATAWAADNG